MFSARTFRRTQPLSIGYAIAVAVSLLVDAPHLSGQTPVRQIRATQEIAVTDDIGHTVRLKRPAQRIISLIPSATETLITIGVADRIVGRTIYDKDPAVKHIQSVGGGLDPNLETILSLRPDLVIGWSAEKRQKLQRRLEEAGIQVFHLSTQDTTDIFTGIAAIGQLTGRDTSATRVANKIRGQFAQVTASVRGKPRPNVLYLTSITPGITAGPKTYIGQIIGVLGGNNLFADVNQNWPRISLEEVARRKPDVIVLPVGEFKANAISRLESSPGWKSLGAVRNKRVIVIDADLINRPGPRIGQIALELRDGIYGQHTTKKAD